MKFSGHCITLYPQVTVLQRTLDGMIVGKTENIRQPEIGSLLAFFVIERGFICSHEAPACLHIRPELITLNIGKGGNIWKDEQPERLQVIGIQEPVTNHFKWHMILNQIII